MAERYRRNNRSVELRAAHFSAQHTSNGRRDRQAIAVHRRHENRTLRIVPRAIIHGEPKMSLQRLQGDRERTEKGEAVAEEKPKSNTKEWRNKLQIILQKFVRIFPLSAAIFLSLPLSLRCAHIVSSNNSLLAGRSVLCSAAVRCARPFDEHKHVKKSGLERKRRRKAENIAKQERF